MGMELGGRRDFGWDEPATCRRLFYANNMDHWLFDGWGWGNCEVVTMHFYVQERAPKNLLKTSRNICMNEDEQRGDAPDAAGVQPIKNSIPASGAQKATT